LKVFSRCRRPAVDGRRAVARHRNGGEADAPDVEPAALRRIVRISPQRLYRLPGVPAECRLEQLVRVRVSRPDAREDADLGDEARLEPAEPSRDLQDAAAAVAAGVDGDGERDENPSGRSESSHTDLGCVAPAFTKMASLGPGSCSLPSAATTAT
jgi:hypothetical protein